MTKNLMNIMEQHIENMNEAVKTIINNKYMSSQNKGYIMEQVGLPRKSYLHESIYDAEKVCYVMQPENDKCIDRCKDAVAKTNPIGMAVPRHDYADDPDIKATYDKMRVVIHDEFDKCVEEGCCEKFVNTITNIKQKEMLYGIPSFNNTFVDFVVDKDVEKVAKDDIAESVDVINNFKSKMDNIIKEAMDLAEWYDKEVYLFNPESTTEFDESVENIARGVLLSEEDFLNTQYIEMRKKALVEQTKNAYKILYGLSTYNPRNIRESSLKLDYNIPMIEDTFDSLIESVDKVDNIPDKASKSTEVKNEKVEKAKDNIVKANNEFVETYKESANESMVSGIFFETWRTPVDVTPLFNDARTAVLKEFSTDRLSKYNNDTLHSVHSIISDLLSITEGGQGYYIADAINFAPVSFKCITDLNEVKSLNTVRSHRLTKTDVQEAVKILESTENDINYINRADKIVQVPYVNNSDSEKSKLIGRINSIKESVIDNLFEIERGIKADQLRTLHAQSKAAILKACGESSEVLREQASNTTSLAEDYNTFGSKKKLIV